MLGLELAAEGHIDKSPVEGTSLEILDSLITIYARENTYVHVEYPNEWKNVSAQCKVKLGGLNCGSSWRPGLCLYWAPGDWCSIGLEKGLRYLPVEMVAGTPAWNVYGAVEIGRWYWVKIDLTPNEIIYSVSENGIAWTPIRAVPRPASLSGPPLVILGKGWGDGVSYPNPDLDNDSPTVLGPFDIQYIDSFHVEELTWIPWKEIAFTMSLFPLGFVGGVVAYNELQKAWGFG